MNYRSGTKSRKKVLTINHGARETGRAGRYREMYNQSEKQAAKFAREETSLLIQRKNKLTRITVQSRTGTKTRT